MSVDKKFKKLDDIDHVILRPGMYIGSIKPHKSNKWLLNENKMSQSEITYNPDTLISGTMVEFLLLNTHNTKSGFQK
jgi:DNA gyrase/topoisomerase IV subunit B